MLAILSTLFSFTRGDGFTGTSVSMVSGGNHNYNDFYDPVVTVTSSPSNVYGSNVTLTCGVFNFQMVYTFVWEVPANSTSLSRSTNVTTPQSSDITFTAQYEDTGLFTCTAEDAAGTTCSGSVSVVVCKFQ